VWASASAWRPSAGGLGGQRRLPARCTSRERAWWRWSPARKQPPGGPGPSPPRVGPAGLAPTHACSFPGLPRAESPVQSTARRWPLGVRTRPVRPGAADRWGLPKTAPMPEYRDATARGLMLGPRGGGPGLAAGIPVTRESTRRRRGSQHRDRVPCGTPVVYLSPADNVLGPLSTRCGQKTHAALRW